MEINKTKFNYDGNISKDDNMYSIIETEEDNKKIIKAIDKDNIVKYKNIIIDNLDIVKELKYESNMLTNEKIYKKNTNELIAQYMYGNIACMISYNNIDKNNIEIMINSEIYNDLLLLNYTYDKNYNVIEIKCKAILNEVETDSNTYTNNKRYEYTYDNNNCMTGCTLYVDDKVYITSRYLEYDDKYYSIDFWSDNEIMTIVCYKNKTDLYNKELDVTVEYIGDLDKYDYIFKFDFIKSRSMISGVINNFNDDGNIVENIRFDNYIESTNKIDENDITKIKELFKENNIYLDIDKVFSSEFNEDNYIDVIRKKC